MKSKFSTALLFLVAFASALEASVSCCDWNLKWFPSGRAEHYAQPATEARNIETAAAVISNAFAECKSDSRILFLQEIRDYTSFTNLAGKTGLTPVVISGFRVRNNRRGWQQCAIATNLKVVESSWSNWKRKRGDAANPPRGYSYALLDGGKDGLIACYCIHLKANYGDTTEAERRLNSDKREAAAKQLAAIIRKNKKNGIKTIVAGDFNTDCFSNKFNDEKTVQIICGKSLDNASADVPAKERITHPGGGRYNGTVFDYILFDKSFDLIKCKTFPGGKVSDHNAVAALLELKD